MLTNEQRAHDLAIALFQTALDSPINASELDEKGNVHRDVLKIYLSLYYDLLESINKEIK